MHPRRLRSGSVQGDAHRAGIRPPRPPGGDGGRGGHIILRANPQFWTLIHLKYRKNIHAEDGESGGSALRHGKNGEDNTTYDGIFYAEDTGGLIKGTKIDMYFLTQAEGKAFSRSIGGATIYVLEVGHFKG